MKKTTLLWVLLLISNIITAQIVKIPDANFKAELLKITPSIDKNGDKEIQVSEAEAYKGDINLTNTDIENVTGIEAFTNIIGLSLYLTKKVTKLDVSKNTKLYRLSLYITSIKELDLSNNLELAYLSVNHNSLNSLNTSKNTALVNLECVGNNLTSLDVSKSVALKELDCFFNEITSLDLSKNPALTSLRCRENKIISLNIANGNNVNLTTLGTTLNPLSCIQVDNVDVAKAKTNWEKDSYTVYNTDCGSYVAPVVTIPDANFKKALLEDSDINVNGDNEIQVFEAENVKSILSVDNKNISNLKGIEAFVNMTYLSRSYNNLTSIDVSNNKKLKWLDVLKNKLTSLDISQNEALIKLNCSENLLESLNISKNAALTELNCKINKLPNLNLSNNKQLTKIVCSNNKISSLDLKNNTELLSFEASSNKLGTIDVSNNLKLTSLTLDHSGITIINVSKNLMLENLSLNGNKMTTINVSKNAELKRLSVNFNNNLRNIDLSKNPKLMNFSCTNYENSLTSLNIANGNNANFYSFSVRGNANLYCVTVDDVAYSNTNWTYKEDHTSFSTNCSEVYKLNITSENGAVTTNPNSTSRLFTRNSKVTITAKAKEFYEFTGWSGNITSTTNPLTVTMDDNKNITANYKKTKHILKLVSTNGVVKIDPESKDGIYEDGTSVTIKAIPNDDYKLEYWIEEDGGVTSYNYLNPLSITMNKDRNITAEYKKISRLSVTHENGYISTSPYSDDRTFEVGEIVKITASPKQGYKFVGWEGDVTGNQNPITLTFDTSKNITAKFVKEKYTLKIITENGSVSTNPNPDNGVYDFETEITLTAKPDEGYEFDRWRGISYSTTNPLKITLTENSEITAKFSKKQLGLTINAENGKVTTSVSSDNGMYDYGTEVTLTPIANDGYKFDGWEGDATGNENPLTITLKATTNITAKFVSSISATSFSPGTKSLNGIAIDKSGTVYVAESYNGKIYKLDENGNRTEFANTKTYINKIAFGKDGNLYATDGFLAKILQIDTNGNIIEYLKLTTAQQSAKSIAFNSKGEMFLGLSSSVIKVNSDKTTTEYVTGLLTPEGIRFDKNDNLYIANRNSRELIKVSPDGKKTTLDNVGGNIQDVEFDTKGNIYYSYSDFRNNNRIYKFDTNTNTSTIYVSENIDSPNGIDIDYTSGNMYIANGAGFVSKIYDENLIDATASTKTAFYNTVSVYPNPVENNLTIVSKNVQIKNIDVFNILGKKIASTKNATIDFSRFASGMYILKIRNFNNQEITKKIIKK